MVYRYGMHTGGGGGGAPLPFNFAKQSIECKTFAGYNNLERSERQWQVATGRR